MAVQEATARAAYGERHAAWSTDEIRAFYVDQKDERRTAWAAVVDGAVVGHLELQIPLADNTHRAAVEILVHPESRRRGIGSALLDVAERAARTERREVMGAESDVATDRDDPAAGFAARHGYTAEQTELRSDLELPLADGVLAATVAETDEHRRAARRPRDHRGEMGRRAGAPELRDRPCAGPARGRVSRAPDRDRAAGRLHDARRRVPHPASRLPVGHPGAARAPRSPARPAVEGREPARFDGRPAGRPPSRDLECARERADAAGQPRAGLRGRRTAHRMAAQARLTSRPMAFTATK